MMATERQNKQGSGANCAVNGCSWNQRKLNSLLNLPRFDHKSLLKKDCSCTPPYKLHRMLDDPDLKKQWLAALKRTFPPQNLFVCSYHFVGKKPTTENPVPELFLRYTKVVKSRRVLVRSRGNTENSLAVLSVSGQRKWKSSGSSVPVLSPAKQLCLSGFETDSSTNDKDDQGEGMYHYQVFNLY